MDGSYAGANEVSARGAPYEGASGTTVCSVFRLLDLYEGEGGPSEASPGGLGGYPPGKKERKRWAGPAWLASLKQFSCTFICLYFFV